MSYQVHKSTFGEGLAYRYKVTDANDLVHYIVEPKGLFLPNPTSLVTIMDAEMNEVGDIRPSSPHSAIWQWIKEFSLQLIDAEAPRAIVEEQWTLADRILLRLPVYRISVKDRVYVARGNQFSEVFYRLYDPPEDLVPAPVPDDEIPEELEIQQKQRWGQEIGQIIRPSSGASYIIDVEAAPLRQDPLTLITLIVLADIHFQEHIS